MTDETKKKIAWIVFGLIVVLGLPQQMGLTPTSTPIPTATRFVPVQYFETQEDAEYQLYKYKATYAAEQDAIEKLLMQTREAQTIDDRIKEGKERMTDDARYYKR